MQELPIDSQIPKILETFQSYPNLILTAAPGAGKTTRLPPALAKTLKKKLIVLEPRRVAAIAAADRVAEEQGWQLGKEVGYQVRFENCTEANTKITFITEALLARKLLNDPELSEYDCVILDEFHERSIHTDLAIGLLKELQSLARPDLKIVVMSATMDAKKVSQFLNEAPIVDVPGRIFEMEVTYSKTSQSLNITGAAGSQFIEKVCDQIKTAMSATAKKTMNDVLVFLPGVGEIRRVHEQIQNWSSLNQIAIFDLHGSLSLQEQKLVLEPLSPAIGKRKLILSTNLAESALTIDGVSVVIDSGLARVMNFHSDTGIPSLNVQRISKASATQRAGRAARQTAGTVYRMWTSLDENSMPNFETAEITRTDLCEVILFLANQGITEFQNFSWYENPDSARLQMAIEQLILWGALEKKDSHHQITPLGKRMSSIPLHPRLARLILEGEKLGQLSLAADICALLSETRAGEMKSSQDLDLHSKLEELKQNRNRYRNISQVRDQLLKLFKNDPHKSSPKNEGETLELLLLSAFPDRICRQRKLADIHDRRAIMTTGLGVEIPQNSMVSNQEFFISLQLMKLSSSADNKASLTSPISKKLILEKFKNQIQEETSLEFNDDTHKYQKIIQKKLFKMPIEEPRFANATQEEIELRLPNLAFEKWDQIKLKNEKLATWITRLNWYEKQSQVHLLTEKNIQAALSAACYGEKSLSTLFEKDLIYFFEIEIPQDTVRNFHEACPESIQVPSGKNIKIQYFTDKNPAIEVRLQEVFGWKENPKISHFSIPNSLTQPLPITLILLGPNYRPVQITQDLAHFWKTSYLEIRKELRGRYPKHKWPEDPTHVSN